jgi:dihydroxyacetone kinase-like predicted kinase
MPKKLGDLILYSVDDLHSELGISKMTIRAYLREGRLKGKKFGVSWYVTDQALKDFFNSPGEENSIQTAETVAPSIDTKVASVDSYEDLSPYTYIVQGINDLVSESEECETVEEVINVLEEQAIISLFQVSTIRKKDGKLIDVLKARDFIEKYQ